MRTADKALCWTYALIAAAALVATWSENLRFFAVPDNGGALGFLRAMYANPAAASIANDLLLFAVAGCIFMVVEGRRAGVRFVYVYVLLALVIAISVAFPAFLVARQIAMAQGASRSA
jgi:hypothetical protein